MDIYKNSILAYSYSVEQIANILYIFIHVHLCVMVKEFQMSLDWWCDTMQIPSFLTKKIMLFILLCLILVIDISSKVKVFSYLFQMDCCLVMYTGVLL